MVVVAQKRQHRKHERHAHSKHTPHYALLRIAREKRLEGLRPREEPFPVHRRAGVHGSRHLFRTGHERLLHRRRHHGWVRIQIARRRQHEVVRLCARGLGVEPPRERWSHVQGLRAEGPHQRKARLLCRRSPATRRTLLHPVVPSALHHAHVVSVANH